MNFQRGASDLPILATAPSTALSSHFSQSLFARSPGLNEIIIGKVNETGIPQKTGWRE
jgi:hypothetical protein